jgi:hypothetical protein
MKIFSSRAHGVMDYVLGLALLAAPYFFGFADLGSYAVIVPQVIGALILVQSLMTDYELSLFKVIPFRMHLMLDYLASAFLALSPFLFGFVNNAPNVWMPHLVAGVAYFVVTLMTRTVPESRREYSFK